MHHLCFQPYCNNLASVDGVMFSNIVEAYNSYFERSIDGLFFAFQQVPKPRLAALTVFFRLIVVNPPFGSGHPSE